MQHVRISLRIKIPRKVKTAERIHIGAIQQDRQKEELVADVGLKNHSCNVGQSDRVWD